MMNLALKKSVSVLVAASLLLSGCSTTSVPTPHQISPGTVKLLEASTEYMQLVALLRADGKTVRVDQGAEFIAPDATQAVIPYDSGANERNFIHMKLEGSTVKIAAINRVTKNADETLTVMTSDLVSRVVLNATSSRDAAGKVSVLSHQIGTMASNSTLTGMFQIQAIQPLQNCTDQLQNSLAAIAAQGAAGYGMWVACGGGALFFSPVCWAGIAAFLAASAYAIFAGDQLKRCQSNGSLNIKQEVIFA